MRDASTSAATTPAMDGGMPDAIMSESAAALATIAPLAAPEPSTDHYEQLIDGGVAEFASGHWAEARLLFERAHQLRPSARTLRALGMSAFNLHHYARAVSELEAALQALEQPLDAALREQSEQLVRRATPLTGRFMLVQAPPEASVSADGAPLVRDANGRVLLDIGRHTLELAAPGYAPAKVLLDVHGGEDASLALHALPLTARPQDAVDSRRSSWLSRRGVAAVTLASAGLAAGAIGLGSWLRADRRFDHIAGDCDVRGGCFRGEADLDGVRRLERTAYGFAGAGACMLVTGAVLGALELFGDHGRERAVKERAP